MFWGEDYEERKKPHGVEAGEVEDGDAHDAETQDENGDEEADDEQLRVPVHHKHSEHLNEESSYL